MDKFQVQVPDCQPVISISLIFLDGFIEKYSFSGFKFVIFSCHPWPGTDKSTKIIFSGKLVDAKKYQAGKENK